MEKLKKAKNNHKYSNNKSDNSSGLSKLIPEIQISVVLLVFIDLPHQSSMLGSTELHIFWVHSGRLSSIVIFPRVVL